MPWFRRGGIALGWRKTADTKGFRALNISSLLPGTFACKRLFLGQRPVEIERQTRFGALFVVEGRLQGAVEIAPYEIVEHVLGVELVATAEEVEPYTKQPVKIYDRIKLYLFSII